MEKESGDAVKLLPGTIGFAFLLAASFGCSGGSSGGGSATPLSKICGGSKSFCVASCNLGCTGTGCTMTDIAVNQMLIFRFNNDVDPSSVNQDTFSIKTAEGTSPTGKYVVNGATVFFVPEIREVGNQTFFGFTKGATYTIYLPAGSSASRSLVSTAGIALQRPLSCTVRVSKDVIDLDGKPPEARMVVPSKTTGVDNRTQIVLEFSEYIIPSTALNNDAVRIVVYQKDPATGMQVPAKREVQVDQLKNWAQLTLTPKVVLPGDINVMVTLNAVIRDLSGKTIRPKSFYFRTAKTQVQPEAIAETFDDSNMMDPSRSGAAWGKGFLQAGRIGGSGILGDFDYRVGSKKVGNAYVFNTDHTTIPAQVTLDGQEHQVTDGVYEFANFHVPAGITVRFEGTHPVKILVRGNINIEGTLDVSGHTTTEVAKWNSKVEAGVPGGLGGPGGAAGGAGGSEPGKGTPQGKNGQDMLLPAGHPKKGQEVGTGGKGSAEDPPNLDPKKVTLDYYTVSSIQLSFPGGGGGSATPGGLGSLTEKPGFHPKHGAPVTASKGFPFLPLSQGKSSLFQLLVGGAGGGGTGVCPWGSFNSATPTWNRGNGGGGGGGALALRAGGNLTVQSTATLLARGGAGGGAGATSGSGLAPGGGGGGGVLVFQAGKLILINGNLDVQGGPSLKSSDLYNTVDIQSAKGGDGYYRAEADPAPSPSVFTKALPSPTKDNVGTLTDRDPVTGAESKWFSTKRIFPKFRYYEVNAVVGGKPVLFTDNPAHPNPCVYGKTPVAFFLQGAQVDEKQKIIETSISWWVKSISDLVDPNKNGGVGVPQVFRWVVLLDKRFAGGQEVKVDRVAVVVSD